MRQPYRGAGPLIDLDRRQLLAGSALLLGGAAFPLPAFAAPGRRLPGFYEEIERRTFRFFWDTVNRKNGLVPDRWPTPSFSSIAAVGFALPAYAIGIERGWCSRAEARDLTLTTLRFFWNAPQGPARSGTTGHNGFFYHFLDMETGVRYRDVELSSVDTTILLMGALFAGQYYDRADPAETEIRKLSAALYERADWNFFRADGRSAISMGWHPEGGLIPANWIGFNEGMFVNILALGSPTHPGPAGLWAQWTSRYSEYWRGAGPTRRLAFAPMFGHQYSHAWIDFRGMRDAPMRTAGFDYFENSRRETYANRAWCIANPKGWDGYSKDVWGLTACDGPGNRSSCLSKGAGGFLRLCRARTGERAGRTRRRHDRPDRRARIAAFRAGNRDPLRRSLAQTARHLSQIRLRRQLQSELPVCQCQGGERHGRSATAVGPRRDYLGIDQGPILLQAANYRDDFVWRHMRRVPAIRRGLERAGFTGGWLVADGDDAAELRDAAFVERLDRGPIAHAAIERAQLLVRAWRHSRARRPRVGTSE